MDATRSAMEPRYPRAVQLKDGTRNSYAAEGRYLQKDKWESEINTKNKASVSENIRDEVRTIDASA